MNVAKWLLSGLLALPLLELVAFIVVAALIGFGWALVLILASSVAGFLILRHAGGNHIAAGSRRGGQWKFCRVAHR